MSSGTERYKYFCRSCGYERSGLLDRPFGIGGYSWQCPECKDGGDPASAMSSGAERELTADSLSEVLAKVKAENRDALLSVNPTHVAYFPHHFNDIRNVAKFLKASRRDHR